MAARLPKPGSDDGVWGDILNDFLKIAHNADGTLKSKAVTKTPVLSPGSPASGDLSGTYPAPTVAKVQGVSIAGVPSSGQILTATSATAATWTTPASMAAPLSGLSSKTATVYADCNLLANSSDLGSFDYNDPVINGLDNGALVIDSVTATVGMRVAVTTYGSYGYTRESGIYDVTDAGSSTSPYVLTRSADANTGEALGRVFATRITGGTHQRNTVYFFPDDLNFTPGSTSMYHAVESWSGFAESIDCVATGDSAHAESNATATGSYSHAEGTSTASAYFAHSEADSTASAEYAHSEGTATASARWAHAEGQSEAYDTFMHSEGIWGGQFNRVVRRAYTSDGTTTVQMSDYYSGSNALTLPDFFRTALLNVRIVARRTDTIGTTSAWTARCLIEGDGDASYRFIGDPSFTLVAQDSAASGWQVHDLAFTDKSLKIGVTGSNGMGIIWHATIEIDELRG